MRGSKSKRIRRDMLKSNIAISGEPYRALGTTVVASDGRRMYKHIKGALKRGG